MMTALLQRIEQRRRIELSGVFNYLQNRRRINEDSATLRGIFLSPSQTVIRKQLKMLIERLSYATDESGDEENILTVANQPIQTQEHSQLML